MSSYYLVEKKDDKYVKLGKTVTKITQLFLLRGKKGDAIAQSVSGKRKIIYKWVEKELLWRPVKTKELT